MRNSRRNHGGGRGKVSLNRKRRLRGWGPTPSLDFTRVSGFRCPLKEAPVGRETRTSLNAPHRATRVTQKTYVKMVHLPKTRGEETGPRGPSPEYQRERTSVVSADRYGCMGVPTGGRGSGERERTGAR